MEQTHIQKPGIFRRKPSRRVLFVSFVLLIAVVGSILFLLNRQSHQVADSSKPLPREAKTLLDELGQKMELPQGETPTMATVTDVSKLDSQPFFKNAQNGDSIIIYSTSRKAILYRRSTHKIIEVAPININSDIQNLQKGQ